MPLLAADPVIVSPEQREALEELVRAHSTPQQLALRARMILHAAHNISVRESARELDIWPKTVRRWRRRWREGARGSRYPSGWLMRRVQAHRRHTRLSRFVR
jgi:putative transposase